MSHTTTGRPAVHNVLAVSSGLAAFMLVCTSSVTGTVTAILALAVFAGAVVNAVRKDERFYETRSKEALR